MLILLLSCGGVPAHNLIFIREQGQSWELWQSNPLQKLEGIPGQSFPGPLDPSGKNLLVISKMGGLETPYRVPLSGETPQALAPPTTRFRNPSWSGDGTWIYASADYHAQKAQSIGDPRGKKEVSLSPEIYRIPAQGGDPGRLTVSEAGSFEPALSPDHQKIALGRSTPTGADIYWMNHDGSQLTAFAEHPAEDIHPQWLGNDQLLWISHRTQSARIWLAPLMHPEQARLLRQENSAFQEIDFVVSPDQRNLAVTVVTTLGDVDLHLISLENPDNPVVISAPGPDEHPAFSKHGWLAFTSSRGGHPAIWACRLDGSELTLVADTGDAAWLPRWVD